MVMRPLFMVVRSSLGDLRPPPTPDYASVRRLRIANTTPAPEVEPVVPELVVLPGEPVRCSRIRARGAVVVTPKRPA